MSDKSKPRPRQLSTGVIIGRAIEKLAALNADEERDLAQSPQAIREKYEAKREALLDGLDPSSRAAVVAAARAMSTEESGPDSE
jgi:hypothetical protein